MGTRDYPTLWVALVVLRVLWVFLPQYGYIHPDEFFQSTEVMAGDILNLDVQRSWEFKAEFPLRSIALPYLVSAPGFHVLKWLSNRGSFTDTLSPPSYWLLVAPRLAVALAGVFVDVLVGKTAENFGIGSRNALLCYATSYVVLVYHSRTFTNTLEGFLFAALLYYVSRSSPWTPSAKRARSSHGCATALILVAGTLNRPTFVGFAFVPLITSLAGWTPKYSSKRICEFFVYGAIFVVLFILADTVYYRDITISALVDEIRTLKSCQELFRVLTITPLNFILYNMHPMNLAEHGTHSRLTHMAVNYPMLFGPCAFFVYWQTVLAFKNRSYRSLRTFLLATTFVPMLLLSLFPHQEPRFLVPLVTPLALLCGSKVFARKFTWKLVRSVWIAFNIAGAFVFGVLHQGGVTRSLIYLHNQVNQDMANNSAFAFGETHIFFFHTYMPPRHLLAKPATVHTVHDDRRQLTDFIHIHDLKGSPPTELRRKIQDLKRNAYNTHDQTFIVVTPATVIPALCQSDTFDVRLLHSIGFHLSFEDPPDLKTMWTDTDELLANCDVTKTTFLQKLSNSFSLNLIAVNLQEKN